MRNKDGRRGRAPIRHGAALRALPVLLAPCMAALGLSADIAAAANGHGQGPWVVRALAADSGCIVLDDGQHARLLCTGERIDPPGLRLLRVDADAAVLEIDGLLGSPLALRASPGASVDVARVRERAREATGPRPGWIELEPAARPQSGEGDRP